MQESGILFLVLACGIHIALAAPCASTAFDFPNAQQLSDFVVYDGSVPDLTAATVCGVVTATRAARKRTLLSYVVDGQDNELLINFNENDIIITVTGETSTHSVRSIDLDGRAFHFCVVFSALGDELVVYVDGAVVSTQSYSGSTVTGGGVLTIGQEQIADSTKAFSGSLSNLYVWPRVLTPAEIEEMSSTCTCPDDHVISLASSNVLLHGDVINRTAACQTFNARDCSFTKFTLPAPDQETDYIRYNGDFPELTQLTLCLWVEADSNRRGTAVLSYAAASEDNELTLWFSSTDATQITYRGTTFTLGDFAGARAHICFTLDTTTGSIVLYVDGIERNSVVASSRSAVRSGGFFVIGQDHDSVSLASPGFQSSQAYSGTVEDLTIWSRILSPSEIYRITVGCSCPFDAAIQFNRNNSIPFGNVAVSSSLSCANGYQLLDYEGCGLNTFTFPRTNQITDYIRVNNTLPEFEEFSFCAWYNPTNFDPARSRIYLSYATTARANALVMFKQNDQVEGFANDASFDFAVGRPLNNETHVCFIVSAITEEMKLYIDGSSVGSTSYIGGKILGNGIFLLGQDQDEVSTASNRGFEANQAFSGTIKNPTIWRRSLTADEVSAIATRCVCPNDHLLIINDNKVETFGPVEYKKQTTCTTLTGENECLNAPCDKYAKCTDEDPNYTCTCQQDFVGNGTSCIATPPPPTNPSHVNASHILVQCTAREIRLSLPVYIAEHFNANRHTMHLHNATCPPTLSPDNSTYTFTVSGNLGSECGTQVQRNATHIIYTNEVRSFVDRDQPIFTGATFSIPFQCAFPSTGNIISINYTVEIATASVSPAGGSGAFQLTSQLFADESFQNTQAQQTFATTDFLYVQIAIATEDPYLTTVLQRCWGTPSANLNDAIQYDIIRSSCPVPEAVDNTVQILSNGNSSEARFEAQVFAFTDGDVIYLHCEVSVCNSATDICVPTCPARKRRDISARNKRQAENDVAYQTIGPFYREVPVISTESNNNSWLVGGILGGVVIVLIAVLLLVGIRCYFAGGRNRDSKDRGILFGFNTFSNAKGVDNPAMMT